MNSEANSPESGVGRADSERIFVTLDATFRNEEQCRVAMETIVNDAHAAYGVNSHFWFTSTDGKSLFVVEQYADARALRMAVRRFTSARVSFFRSIKDFTISIYGDATFAILAMFSLMRPKHMNYYGGFAKAVGATTEPGIKDFERGRVFVVTNATVNDEAKAKDAMAALVEKARAESGTSSHFWTRGKDGKDLVILEQFADEQAFLDHIVANSTSRAAIRELIEVGDVTVYGAESSEVEEILSPLSPTYMTYYGGYSK